MHNISIFGYLIKLTGKQKTTVKAGIERTVLLIGPSSYLNTPQHIVPALLGCVLYFIKPMTADFFKISESLLHAYE